MGYGGVNTWGMGLRPVTCYYSICGGYSWYDVLDNTCWSTEVREVGEGGHEEQKRRKEKEEDGGGKLLQRERGRLVAP